MSETVFLCAGGDKRFVYTCEELSKSNEVYSVGLSCSCEKVNMLSSLDDMKVKADALVLPFMQNVEDNLIAGEYNISLADLTKNLKPAALVFGGLMREEHRSLFEGNGYEVADYYNNESLVLKNCIPTAEGTLAVAMENTDKTIFGSKVLICGYGRTASACADLFKAVGARCTVAARSAQARSEAVCKGFDALDINILDSCHDRFDIIINTVPAMIFDRSRLEKIDPGTLLIDIASKPGGYDHDAAEELGIKAVHALGLPGRVAPVTSGRFIAETVLEILNERGRTDVR